MVELYFKTFIFDCMSERLLVILNIQVSYDTVMHLSRSDIFLNSDVYIH